MSSKLGLLVFVGFVALSIPAALSTSYIDNIGSPSKSQHENGQPPDYFLYVDEETTLPKINSLDDTDDDASIDPDLEVHPRWKRDTGEPSWKVVGAGLTRTFKRLVAESRRIPPNIKLAIDHGNFSNVTERDIESIDPTLLEYIPPHMFPSMSRPVKNKIIDIFLTTNRAHVLSNFLEATAKEIDHGPETMLSKIRLKHGARGAEEPPNEAQSVLIYTAANRKLGNDTTDQVTIATLRGAGLLKYVPEELFMKIRSSDAARTLLATLYQKPLDAETNNIDDKALIYRLIEVGYGSAGNITLNKFDNLLPKFYATLPAAFLRKLPHDLVKAKLPSFKTISFGTTSQRKAVADSYLESQGIETNNIEGATSVTKQQGTARGINLRTIAEDLGDFSAFINPSITQDDQVHRKIVDGCSRLDLPAPVKTVHQLIKQQLRGNRQINNLNRNDFQFLGDNVLVNSPPAVIRQAVSANYFNRQTLEGFSHKVENSPSSTYLKGLIQQLSKFAYDSVHNHFNALPPAFLNAIGIGNLQRQDANGLREILEKLNKSQDSLDEVQKGVLIRRLQAYGVLDLEQDQSVVPPAIAALLPRAKNQRKILPSIVSGLPSESDLRLAFGEQHRHVGLQQLVDEPLLVGTLTPTQVKAFHLDDIPAVLSTIRKSSDGPSSHTLKVLSERFADYIRNKTDDKDSDKKKLLKYLSAAEVSRLPGTILAYFMDSRYVRRLPDEVRKEIMIALGTLSTKDHALIPSRTREEIVRQGLEALDKTLPDRNVYDVVVVATMAHSVVDLPPDRIRKLTPVALELALDVVQGNVDDDDDGLRQRACLQPDQKTAWRNKIIETYGTPNTWTHGTVTSLCCALVLLEERDLRQIAKENLVTCKCISDERPPSHLKNLRQALNGACAYELGRPDSSLFTLNKVQAESGLDIEDLEEEATKRDGRYQQGRRNRSHHRTRRDGGYSVQGQGQDETEHDDDPKPLRCTTLRLVGSASEYKLDTVNTFWEKEIEDCLYELGIDPLSIEAARAFWTKLVNMHDKNVRRISSFTLRKAGYILRGITKGEVDQLDFNDDDIIAPFGVNLGLPKILLEHMATHLEHAKKREWQQFNAHDIIVAGNIICGANVEKLTRLDPTHFRNALPHLKGLHQDCEMTRLAVLANIATNPSVFGDSSTWTAADIRGLGIIFKGLTSKEVAKIPAEAFLGLSPSVAANLVPETLRVLTPQQVDHIPRFSALAMRSEQIDTLNPEARGNLESNKKGSLVSGTTTNKVQVETVWTLLTLGITILFAQRVL